MRDTSPKLPAPISEDLGLLIGEMEAAGYTVVKSEYTPELFGNYYVDFNGPAGPLRIVRDRSRYAVSGEREALELAGLWRSFDDRHQFVSALSASLMR